MSEMRGLYLAPRMLLLLFFTRCSSVLWCYCFLYRVHYFDGYFCIHLRVDGCCEILTLCLEIFYSVSEVGSIELKVELKVELNKDSICG